VFTLVDVILTFCMAQAIFDDLKTKLNSSIVKKIGGIYQFDVKGADGVERSWLVDLKNGDGSIKTGADTHDVKLIFSSEEDFIQLMTGKAKAQALFMKGKLKIKGKMPLAMKLEELMKAAAKPSASNSSNTATSSEKKEDDSPTSEFKATKTFEQLKNGLDPSLVQKVKGVYQFDIKGSAGKTQSWLVDLKNGSGSIKTGTGPNDCLLSLSDDDFVDLFSGKLKAQSAYMQGRLKIKGNMGLAMKLELLMKARSKL